MSVRWKDKADITALAADDRMPVTDVSDSNVDKYTTPAEIATYVKAAANLPTTPGTVTDDAVPRYDGTDGLALKNSGVTIDDNDFVAGAAGVGIGGATADATNRLSANTPAVLFNRGTDDIQVKLNKAAAGDTASFLFQTGFSGRAEIGTTGDDDFHFKVSPDGSTFRDAITIDKDDGAVSLPQGILDLPEISAPSSPAANVARLFARDVNAKTQLALKDATGTIIDLFRGIVSVTDFGAQADGSDDAPEIQAAIDWCESLGGGLIYSPPGDYRLGAGLVTNSGSISFLGAGVDATTWTLDDAVNQSVLTFSQVNAGYFSGISIDGNRANQTTDGDGITLDRCNNVIIERFYIQDAYRYGIGVTGAAAQRRNKILNGFIEDTGAHGIFINDDDTHTKEAIYISGMFVQRPGRNASLSDQACYYITGWSVISDSFAREFEDVAATRGFWFAEGDDSPSVGANNSTATNCHARGVTYTAGNVGFLMDARHIKLVGCFASELGTGYFWRQQDGSAVACHAHRGRHGFVTEDSSGFDTNGDKISLMNCVAALQSSGVTDGVGFLIGGDDNQLVGCDVRDKNYGVDIEASAANTRVVVLEANNITTAVVRDGGSNSILDFIPDISPTGRLQSWKVVAASAVAVPHTGDTNETTLATVSLPAGAMGANGMLRIVSTWTVTNSADDKTPRVRLGGISGTAMLQAVLTTSASARFETIIQNRNSAASQVGFARSSVQSFTNSSSANTTATTNTAVAQDLVITGQLEATGDTITLESYSVELFYQT